MKNALETHVDTLSYNISAPEREAACRFGIEFGHAILDVIEGIIKSHEESGRYSVVVRLSEMVDAEVKLTDPEIRNECKHLATASVKSHLRDNGYIVTQWQSGQLLIEW